MTAVSPPPALGGDRVLGLLPDLKRDTLGTLERARREHGDIVCLLAGPPRMRTRSYAIFHPDGVRRVLATEADAYRKDNRFYEEVRWALGYGLLNSQDAEWLRQRRFVQPLFTRRRIASYAGTMGEEAEALLAAGWTDGRTRRPAPRDVRAHPAHGRPAAVRGRRRAGGAGGRPRLPDPRRARPQPVLQPRPRSARVADAGQPPRRAGPRIGPCGVRRPDRGAPRQRRRRRGPARPADRRARRRRAPVRPRGPRPGADLPARRP